MLLAFAALGHAMEPRLLDDPVLIGIAQRLGKTPAQVALAWAVQRGTALLTTSVSPGRIRENFEISALPDDAMQEIREKVATNVRFNSVVETGVPGFIPRGRLNPSPACGREDSRRALLCLVLGHPAHDFFLGHAPAARPFNSVEFGAFPVIEVARLPERRFHAWHDAGNPVLIEMVPVENFRVSHGSKLSSRSKWQAARACACPVKRSGVDRD